MDEPRVHLVQWMCPQRHCILAIAYLRNAHESDADALGRASGALKFRFAEMGLNPWCGICGSRDLHFEDGATPWPTLAEAAPHLATAMVQNLSARRLLDATGQSFDGRRARGDA